MNDPYKAVHDYQTPVETLTPEIIADIILTSFYSNVDYMNDSGAMLSPSQIMKRIIIEAMQGRLWPPMPTPTENSQLACEEKK